jgi:N6-adenosine-specific RNA methylase IME4
MKSTHGLRDQKRESDVLFLVAEEVATMDANIGIFLKDNHPAWTMMSFF